MKRKDKTDENKEKLKSVKQGNKRIKMKDQIVASILSANRGELNKEMLSIKTADQIQVDVMDGHFVHNINFGPDEVKDLKFPLPFEIHLMISNPQDYIKQYTIGKPKTIIFHYEAVKKTEIKQLIQQIKKHARVGIALKPKTKVEVLKPYLKYVDEILIMTVEPGFGGQKFMTSMLPKIQTLREQYNYKGDIEVDGGVNARTIKQAKKAGANMFVSGSYLQKYKNIKESIEKLKKAL